MSPADFKSSGSSLIANETDAFNIPCALLSLVCHFSLSFLSSTVMAFPEVVSDASGIAEPARAFLDYTVPVAPGARLIHLARFGSSSSPSAAFHESASCRATSIPVRQPA
ncbi:hypothetical protein EHS25_001726 [Saitozyma podzolica]|uniref:Uncharacterized protein n=1 Tax=Saitozyma podzolica TaxID=1890683 RepID=A0A427YF99_9TREE|nr:hypothetical protein EHS25_001726 [Saitozyma podzolica]